MNKGENFEKVLFKLYWLLGGIAVLHVLFFSSFFIFGDFIGITKHADLNVVPGRENGLYILFIVWALLNDAFGIFAMIFATSCFTVKKKWLKYLSYPAGILIIIAIFCTLSFPFGLLGIVIGGITCIIHVPRMAAYVRTGDKRLLPT